MKTTILVEALLYDRKGALPGADLFQSKYGEFRDGPTTLFRFPTSDLAEKATLDLRRLKVEYEVFYDFHLSSIELETWPAFYFGLDFRDNLFADDLVDADALVGADIALDYSAEILMISNRGRHLFDEYTRELKWRSVQATDSSTWFALESIGVLFQPIFIPRPTEIGENVSPPGTLAVRSDGRDVMSRANLDQIAKVGLAKSVEFETPSQAGGWRTRYVASGRLVSAIRESGLGGLLEPLAPLLAQGHPLASPTRSSVTVHGVPRRAKHDSSSR